MSATNANLIWERYLSQDVVNNSISFYSNDLDRTATKFNKLFNKSFDYSYDYYDGIEFFIEEYFVEIPELYHNAGFQYKLYMLNGLLFLDISSIIKESTAFSLFYNNKFVDKIAGIIIRNSTCVATFEKILNIVQNRKIVLIIRMAWPMPYLELLDEYGIQLSHCALIATGIQDYSCSKISYLLRNCHSIDLHSNCITDIGVNNFLQNISYSHDACLGLSGNCLSLKCIDIDQMSKFRNLALNLSTNELSERSFSNLFQLSNITSLWLEHNNFTSAFIEALVGSSILSQLEILSLNSNLICDYGAKAISNSDMFSQLQMLSLKYNLISSMGKKYLKWSPNLTRCRLYL